MPQGLFRDGLNTGIEGQVDVVPRFGRIDAVFPRDDGGWTVVDWKTGAQPVGPESEVRAVQLATYVLAFARLRGVDPSRVDAAFFYAADGVTVRPAVPDERILVAMLSAVPE